MTLVRIGNCLKATAARFARAERGNVAMMFAVVLPVLLTAVGAAIDYTRASKVRAAMQSAADAAALMVSKEAAGLTPTEVTDKAKAYFKALFDYPEVANPAVSAVYTANSGTGASLKINVSGSMTADIMKVDIPMSASSMTKWGNIRYRVALALDNTGSMADDGKMTQLKVAATKLINDFYGMAGSNDDVYISIVPFAQDVNVGNDKKDEPWIRWTDWNSENTHKACTKPAYTTKTTCQNNGGSWISVADSHSTWNGCVKDRDQSYDLNITIPDASVTGTMAPAQQIAECPVSMIKMTSVKASKQTLLDKIDDMLPVGYTNQAIGIFWAWMTHATSGPFPTPAKDANYVYQDVIILLTDGLNTRNRWYNDQASIDTRQGTLCTNARTAGVKIFAIQVATNGDPVSAVTKNCTTQPDNPNYFSLITQASQMTVKFDAIFKELAKLRVAS
jgi:Flp pilus assembly protein TadG